MKLQVTFTVDIDSIEDDGISLTRLDDQSKQCVEEAVAEAITNAIRYAEGNGHVHSMDEQIAILCDSTVVAKFLE